MEEKLIRDALMLWATIDPIGTLAIFASVTAALTPGERRKSALKATLYSALILLGAIVAGQILLSALGIDLISLQVAGGAILFLFALQMIFGSKMDEQGGGTNSGHDIAVFPLAVPSIASPGAIMAVIVLTDNNLHGIAEQAVTAGVLVGVLVVTCLLMLASTQILRVIGSNGAAILIRVMGLILAALSVQLVFEALEIGKWITVQ
jgi:multiple antibiotic resistance protein